MKQPSALTLLSLLTMNGDLTPGGRDTRPQTFTGDAGTFVTPLHATAPRHAGGKKLSRSRRRNTARRAQ